MEGKDIILDCFRKADLFWWFGLISNYENEKIKEIMIKVIQNVKSDDFSKAFKDAKNGLKAAKAPYEKILFLEICGNCAYLLGNLKDAEKYYSDGLRNVEEVSAQNKTANFIKGSILGNFGLIISRTINLDKGLKLFQDTLVIYQELGFKLGQAHQIANIGFIYYMKGDLRSAFQQIQNALELNRSIGDREGEGLDLIKLSKIFEELRDNYGIGAALNQDATVFLKRMQLPDAEKLFTQALKINRKIGAKSAIAYALGQIGYTFFCMGYYEADGSINDARNISNAIGDRYLHAFLTNLKGFMTLTNTEGIGGDLYIQEAIELSRALGATLDEGIYTHQLGWNAFADAQLKDLVPVQFRRRGSVKEFSDKAIQNYEEALKIYKKVDYKYGETNELLHIAKVHKRFKNSELALKYLNQALEVAREIMDKKSEAEILMELGEIAIIREGPLTALKYLQESLELIKKIEHKHLEALCLKSIYTAYFEMPNPEKGGIEKCGLNPEEYFRNLLESMLNCIKVYQEMHMLSDASEVFNEMSNLSSTMGDNNGAKRFKSQADSLNRIYQQEYNLFKNKSF
jgi:tetratricopeptide (TPR) repeat protein